jgi:hypothetical protein
MDMRMSWALFFCFLFSSFSRRFLIFFFSFLLSPLAYCQYLLTCILGSILVFFSFPLLPTTSSSYIFEKYERLLGTLLRVKHTCSLAGYHHSHLHVVAWIIKSDRIFFAVCGQSTLMRLCCRHLRPAKGSFAYHSCNIFQQIRRVQRLHA